MSEPRRVEAATAAYTIVAMHRSPLLPGPTAALPRCCPAPLFSEPAAEFWDNLLRDKFSTQQEAAAATLGRGARERGKVRACKEGGGGERGSRARCVCIEGWRGARAGAGGGASTLRGGGRGAGWVS